MTPTQQAAVQEQQAAVHAIVHGSGDVAIVAAAGSGKTRVVTDGVVGLLAQGVPPEEILLVTFSKAAQTELAGRIARSGLLTPAQANRISNTFDALAVKRCREYQGLSKYRYKSNGVCKNETTCFDYMADTTLRNSKTGLVHEGKNDIWTRAIGGEKSIAAARIDEAFAVGVGKTAVAGVALTCGLLFAAGLHPASEEAKGWITERGYDLRIPEWYANFETILDDYGKWTFQQAMHDWSKDVGPGFRYVIVDEAQDTNPIQMQVVRELSRGGKLVLVGDPRQTIHTWRGADPQLFADFMASAGTTCIHLRYNWRSIPAVVEAGNTIVRGQEWAPVNAVPVRESEDGTACKRCYKDPAELLIAVMTAANQYLQEGQQMAYLARTWAELETAEWALLNAGLRFNKKRKSFSHWQRNQLRPPDGVDWRTHLRRVRGGTHDSKRELLCKLASKYPSYQAFKEATDWYVAAANDATNAEEQVYPIYLGTVHSVKGAEFDTVLLQASEAWPNKEEADEIRLFYVGVTRAKNVLLIFGPLKDRIPEEVSPWR